MNEFENKNIKVFKDDTLEKDLRGHAKTLESKQTTLYNKIMDNNILNRDLELARVKTLQEITDITYKLKAKLQNNTLDYDTENLEKDVLLEEELLETVEEQMTEINNKTKKLWDSYNELDERMATLRNTNEEVYIGNPN